MPMLNRLAAGGLAGALAVPCFHQPVAALLGALEFFPAPAFVLPGLWRGMAFSMLWGLLFLWLRPRLARLPMALAGALYGATVPIAYLFFVMAPWRGVAIAYGMPPHLIFAVVLAHAVFGFGIAAWLTLLRSGLLGGWLARGAE